MKTEALITMLCIQIPVVCITAYFFYKVLKTPKKSEPDSYSENEES